MYSPEHTYAIFAKRIRLKNWLIISCIALVLFGCAEASSRAEAPELVETPEDSLDLYPRTPATMDKASFRQYFRMVSRFFDSTLLRRGFNGGLLIAKNGQIIYENYQGFMNFRTREAITDSSAFHIASTSKTFTGVAILQLVQAQQLSLTDSLEKFFPGIPYPGITVKMLLSHRSGLPNYLYFIDQKKWPANRLVTNNDVLQALYTEKPARQASPNRRFQYCNTNYVLLALILEKVTGSSYPDYIRSHFFAPLEMNHSFVYNVSDSLKVHPSFNPNGTIWRDDIFEGTYGDKNIYSTPRDLLKWDQALYTETLVKKELRDSAFTPYSNEKPSIHNYGLGFRMLNFRNGKNVIYHFGRWHGFNAAFARLIDEKVTVIVLGNKFNRNIYNAASQSYQLFGPYRNDEGAGDE